MVGAEVRGVWDGFLQGFKSLQESLREALLVKSPVIWLLTALYPEIRVRGRDCDVDNRRNGASVGVKTTNCSSSTVLFTHSRCTYCLTCEWNACVHFPELKASEKLKPFNTNLQHHNLPSVFYSCTHTLMCRLEESWVDSLHSWIEPSA